MEPQLIVLGTAVFGAAALQAATGIGFGVIAGPVLLVALNDGAAIQISIMLNLVIALALAPSLWPKSDRQLLTRLLIGVLIGSPVGLLLYFSMDVVLLKSFAGLVVVFTLVLVLRGDRGPAPVQPNAGGGLEQASVGVMAGLMGSSLGMPGPVPAAWMLAKGFTKDTIRSTVLVMFVVAYGIALVLQLGLAEIGADTLRLTAMLVPATIGGIVVGRSLASRISESVFRWVLTTILALTAISLLSTLH